MRRGPFRPAMLLDGRAIGYRELHPIVVRRYELGTAVVFEIELDALLETRTRYREVSRFRR